MIGDLHLDAVTAGLARHDEVARAMRFATEVAERAGAEVLCMGDVCDPGTGRSHRAVAECVAVDREARERGVRWRWLTGNHDVVEDGSGTSTLEPLKRHGAEVLDRPAVLPLGGCRLLALPFVPASHGYDPADVAAGLHTLEPQPTIVAGHLSLEGAHPGSETRDMPRGRDVFWPLEQLAGLGPRVLLAGGHYHRGGVQQGVHIVGSAARLTHGEEDHSPVLLIAQWTGERWDLEQVPIPGARQLVTIEPRDSVWTSAEGELSVEIDEGAIVRVMPPAGASAERVERLVAALEDDVVAERVWVGRAEAADPSPDPGQVDEDLSIREAVSRRVDAARVEDRDALVTMCDELLTGAGA